MPARVAVVGHVEWIEFARVERVPASGEIVHALDAWGEPGGGGAVAAVQLARLAGDCLFLTALADDELGHRAERELTALGVRVEVSWRREAQRRAFVFTDANAERTITVLGDRLGPRRDDPLPWSELEGVDGVYFTAGDAGAVRAARAARTLVSTARTIEPLAEAGVQLDMLVSRCRDAVEALDGQTTAWTAAPLPGPPLDAYGAGDCFAAGLTYGLADGRSPQDALALGARCGAASVTGRGPYRGQLAGDG